MPADIANAWDLDKARRRGIVYHAGAAAGWKCPIHLLSLQREGNYLFCPRCCVTIYSPSPVGAST